MENEKIKEMLLDIAPTNLDFTVIQTGKKSKRVNGLYSPTPHEIILHNKNFSDDNQLVYTAVHEYTHHLASEKMLNTLGVAAVYNAKCHTQSFWASFDELITIAEEKGYYKLSIDVSDELKELTEKIKKEYLEKNGVLMKEFGRLLVDAHILCEKNNIRYEDYIDRILCLPRVSADSIRKVAVSNANPALGFDNMKFVASISNADDRKEAETELLQGKSPAGVREMMRRKKHGEDDEDKAEKLEREKNRLERTIASLSKRLELVEEAIANL